MTYHAAFYSCDKCSRRADAELTPEGWVFDVDVCGTTCDLCPTCKRLAPTQRQSEEPK